MIERLSILIATGLCEGSSSNPCVQNYRLHGVAVGHIQRYPSDRYLTRGYTEGM